jgi:hypothetical protein
MCAAVYNQTEEPRVTWLQLMELPWMEKMRRMGSIFEGMLMCARPPLGALTDWCIAVLVQSTLKITSEPQRRRCWSDSNTSNPT